MKAKLWRFFASLMFTLSFIGLVSAQTGQVYFKEDFNYASLDQMQAAGWTFTRPAGISLSGGAITLDGTGGDCAISRPTSFSNNVYDWKAEVRAMWLGQGHSVLSVFVYTAEHSYGWAADGYYKEFSFYRDSQKILHFGNYAEKAGEYVILTMVRDGNIFSFYFNGNLINTYNEEDATPSKVTSLALVSPWRGDAKYDYFQIGEPNAVVVPLNPSEVTSSFPLVPVLIGGGITAAVIGGIAVYYFFIAGGSNASAGASAGSGLGSAGTGSAGSSGSEGSGLAIQGHPLSPLSGEAPLSPMAGQSGFVQEQMNNVTQTMSVMQDMVQEMLGLVGQNSIHSASWLGMGSGYSGGSTGDSAGGVAVGASTGSTVANSNIAPTQTGVPFGGSIVVDTVDSLMNSLTSQGQQLVNEGTTQNSIDQGNYQQYLENCTNMVEMLTNIVNTQHQTNLSINQNIR